VTGVAVKDGSTFVTSDEELLLFDISQESVVYQRVSTPLRGHPAAMDIDDVVSSIRGNLPCICFVVSAIQILQYLYFVMILSFLSFRISKLLYLFSCRVTLNVLFLSTFLSEFFSNSSADQGVL